jgi:hypothetical protein
MLLEASAQTCIQCGETKVFADFYDHPQMRNGKMGVCKACHKHRMFINRRTNPRVQEYDRLRGKRPHRVKASQERVKRLQTEEAMAYRARYTVRTRCGTKG